MNALFISNDPNILVADSGVRARMREYAAAIGTLHILMRTGGKSEEVAEAPLFIHAVASRKLDIGALVRRAKDLITTNAIEVVSAQDPFEHGLIALRATRGTTAKLHVQIHTDFLSPWFTRGEIFRSPNITPPVKNRIRQALADRVLPKADGIRVVSARIKDSLVKRYGARIPEPTVLPIAVGSVLPQSAPLPQLPFPFVMLTAGRLEPEKRIEDIIEALSRIREKYPAVGLAIVGDGSERPKLEAMVAEKALGDRVAFLGALPNAWGLMRSCQCYIQASAYEGYGRTLVEAALARVPIITTDVGIVGEVLAGYDDVLATPPGDPQNLAFHMVGVLEDRQSSEVRIRSAEAKALAHLKQYENLSSLVASDLSRLTTGSTAV